MLLRVMEEDVVGAPFEIDTGVEHGCRWVQIWRGRKCLRQFKSMDEAIQQIEEMLALEENT